MPSPPLPSPSSHAGRRRTCIRIPIYPRVIVGGCHSRRAAASSGKGSNPCMACFRLKGSLIGQSAAPQISPVVGVWRQLININEQLYLRSPVPGRLIGVWARQDQCRPLPPWEPDISSVARWVAAAARCCLLLLRRV